MIFSDKYALTEIKEMDLEIFKKYLFHSGQRLII